MEGETLLQRFYREEQEYLVRITSNQLVREVLKLVDNEKSDVIKMKPGTSLKNWRVEYKESMAGTGDEIEKLHPSVVGVLQFFEYEHLPPELQWISARFGKLAYTMAHSLPNNPQMTKALDTLLTAKDQMVRTLIYKNPEELDIG